MNYYIQGDAANAEQIKAAFERNGIDTSANSNYGISNLFYYSYNGEVAVTQNRSIINIVKTHPDYQELELPVEPKFKVGDWIVHDMSDGRVSPPRQIIALTNKSYILDGECFNSFYFKDLEESFRKWTIQDAKDGDVLSTDNGWTCIFKDLDLFNEMFSSYCFMEPQKLFCEFGSNAHTLDSRINGNIHPSTKEQRDLLFSKMKDAGYTWDDEKKELNKIQPHYDIANFHAGMPVLVRDANDKEWRYVLFSHNTARYNLMRFNAGATIWEQCIPFNEDTKHLLGTTDMCDEQYINW